MAENVNVCYATRAGKYREYICNNFSGNIKFSNIFDDFNALFIRSTNLLVICEYENGETNILRASPI